MTRLTDTLAEGYTVKAASNLFDASLFEKETASADRFDMSKTACAAAHIKPHGRQGGIFQVSLQG